MVRPVRFQLAFTYHTVSILRVYVADAYQLPLWEHNRNTIRHNRRRRTGYGVNGGSAR